MHAGKGAARLRLTRRSEDDARARTGPRERSRDADRQRLLESRRPWRIRRRLGAQRLRSAHPRESRRTLRCRRLRSTRGRRLGPVALLRQQAPAQRVPGIPADLPVPQWSIPLVLRGVQRLCRPVSRRHRSDRHAHEHRRRRPRPRPAPPSRGRCEAVVPRFSYGTYIGNTYANLFPKNVTRSSSTESSIPGCGRAGNRSSPTELRPSTSSTSSSASATRPDPPAHSPDRRARRARSERAGRGARGSTARPRRRALRVRLPDR